MAISLLFGVQLQGAQRLLEWTTRDLPVYLVFRSKVDELPLLLIRLGQSPPKRFDRVSYESKGNLERNHITKFIDK